MISKGDLVKLRVTLSDGPEGRKELHIFGKMMNYCDEEDDYILEARAFSIQKKHVAEAERLLEDFDFENISEELDSKGTARELHSPPDITNIRISRRH
jgi:hypothetical protein